MASCRRKQIPADLPGINRFKIGTSGEFGLKRGAEIDLTGSYRYTLWREWNSDAPGVGFVMLNPSTADATIDDATIRRCTGFARSWGFGALEVVNLFAYRATNPATLRQVVDPIGPLGDRYLLEMRRRAQTVVVSWGNQGSWQNRDQIVLRLLSGRDIYCLGRTQLGHPRHPLYLKANTALIPFQWGDADHRL